MRDIQKSDIVGARIVDVYHTEELLDGWLDCTEIYFTVDRGFTFTLPWAGERWVSVDLPEQACHLWYPRKSYELDLRGWFPRLRFTRQPSIIDQIKQRRISGVYCGAFDEEIGCHYPPEGTLVFEDGSQAFNNMVAPQGVGGTGLRFFLPESRHCTPLEQMADYFTIPLRTK
jgi:hypothetical protein